MDLISSLFKKNTLTRESLAKAIKRETGIPSNKSSKIVDQLVNIMILAINDDKEVKIRKFGSFKTRKKNERIGRNPKTMVHAKIPARRVIKFKVAPTLKKRINSNIHQIN
jgi:integration host factor subunit alpha